MSTTQLDPPKLAPDRAAGRGITLLLVALVAFQLVPIWAFAYIPTADGPAHVQNCYIIRNYHNPAVAAFREFFTLRSDLDPNLGGHLLMTSLMYLVSPLLAEKILLTFYVLLMPVAFAYALRQIRASAAVLAVLILPFTFTYTFQMGFYNFSLGVPVFFLVAGYWLKHRENMRARHAMVLALLLLGLYSCHIVPMTLAIVFIAVMGSWLTIAHIGRSRQLTGRIDWDTVRGGVISRLIIPGLAALPTLVLFANFMINARRKHLLPPKHWDASRKEQLLRLVRFDYFPAFRAWESWVFQGLGILIVIGGILALVAMFNRSATPPCRLSG